MTPCKGRLSGGGVVVRWGRAECGTRGADRGLEKVGGGGTRTKTDRCGTGKKSDRQLMSI